MNKGLLSNITKEERELITKNPTKMKFAHLVVYICKAMDISYTYLAESIGCNRSLFSEISNGNIPSRRLTIALGTALGFDLEQMKIFLWLGGYAFNELDDLDQFYMKAIKATPYLTPQKRITICNDLLDEFGVKEKDWLGNFQRKKYCKKER